jgi:short subunit dehydrogenase-like uncharacterized protein
MPLLYGAYGYTGRLIAAEAARQGLALTLAGRDAGRLRALADDLGFPARAFALDDDAALEAACADARAVLHAAGPFAATAAPVVRACLRTGTPYLDVTGEIAVFERLARHDRAAREAGIPLLPGVGFDVVPTDSLAAHLHRHVPDAVRLEIAFTGRGGVSRGSLRTIAETLGQGGAIRRYGRLERVPAAWQTRTVDFGRGPVTVATIPWGDVATAYRSTGIATILTYVQMPSWLVAALRLSRPFGPVLASAPVKAALRAGIALLPPGPSAAARAAGRSAVWAAVTTPDGATTEARLTGPEPYTFTAQAAVAVLQRVVGGDVPAGYQTPATALGPDFVLTLPGVTRHGPFG